MNTYANSNASSGCGSCGQGASGCTCGGKCGSCGSGEYVRPRFFAGQLLTEDDLQSLADYVSAKNRLHNRHLFGAGVVCGLQVICNPCGGGKVTVESGYALDCCGNDLVLTCSRELDINALIRDLKTRLLGGYDCGDPCPDALVDCKQSGKDNTTTKDPAGPRHYCLYIRYCEEETDPVAPYDTGEPCIAAGCEPTRIREGVRFELRCLEKEPTPNDFFTQLLACIGDLVDTQDIFENIGKVPSPETMASFKEWLLIRMDKYPRLADCELRRVVGAIVIPDEKAGTEALGMAFCHLVEALLRYLRDCFCKAVNPPCAPCDDSAVLLACLTVQDCQVTEICNLERTFVLTPVAWRYWNPLIRAFGELVEKVLCCSAIDLGCDPTVKKSVQALRAATSVEVPTQTTAASLLSTVYPNFYSEDIRRIVNIGQSLWRFIPQADSRVGGIKGQAEALLGRAAVALDSKASAELASVQAENTCLKSDIVSLGERLSKLESVSSPAARGPKS